MVIDDIAYLIYAKENEGCSIFSKKIFIKYKDIIYQEYYSKASEIIRKKERKEKLKRLNNV